MQTTRTTLLVGLLQVMLAACDSTGNAGRSCDESSCAGCCTADGKCQMSTATTCGVNGAACVACSATAACREGACVEGGAGGGSATAGGNGSTAGGSGSTAGGSGSTAGGSGSTAGGSGSTAGGSGSTAGGSGAMAGGSGAMAGGSGSTAGGSGATAGGSGAMAGGSGADGGQCPCLAGQRRCNSGGLAQTCSQLKSDGCYDWDTGTACASGSTCSGPGVCSMPTLSVSSNTQLCGVHYVSGAVNIVGGASVTCPSGDLEIHADTILVDPASSIDLSATSNDSPAAASQFCGIQAAPFVGGAAGGSYGTRGENGGFGYSLANRFGACSPNSGAMAGPVLGSAYDVLVRKGSRGGTARAYYYDGDGGMGGGRIALYASTSANIQGTLRVDGANGGNSDCFGFSPVGPGAGAGSGGGILVSAPSVTVTATAQLSAKGGTGGGSFCSGANGTCNCTGNGGNGGEGRVKLVHGGQLSNQGMLSMGAVLSADVAPPLAIASATHPDPTRFYNDGSQRLQVSWVPPIAGAQGYYYAVDQNADAQLTAMNGTFTTATQVTLPAGLTGAGTWFFHVLTVKGTSQLSTLSNRFDVRINGAAHALASSSHPVQTDWYSDPSKKTVSMGWSPPSGVPASSFKGVWYRLDQTTTPPPVAAAAGWTFTATGQVITDRDFATSLLHDGTYHFHAVSEDTLGTLTKAMATYTLQLGAMPSQTSVFGYVTSNTSQPAGVFAQTYQVTAAKTGFQNTTRSVAVNAAASPVNLTLTP